jgi:hypothetical protein
LGRRINKLGVRSEELRIKSYKIGEVKDKYYKLIFNVLFPIPHSPFPIPHSLLKLLIIIKYR